MTEGTQKNRDITFPQIFPQELFVYAALCDMLNINLYLTGDRHSNKLNQSKNQLNNGGHILKSRNFGGVCQN